MIYCECHHHFSDKLTNNLTTGRKLKKLSLQFGITLSGITWSRDFGECVQWPMANHRPLHTLSNEQTYGKCTTKMIREVLDKSLKGTFKYLGKLPN